ncbi:MAG: adenosylcobinamide-GDP ribazoletransferase [Candidatus Methanomethylophilaceae archaeon]|jgi:adenosylcobinamide-GDP ribazoletransferase
MEEERKTESTPKKEVPSDAPVIVAHEKKERVGEPIEETSESAQVSYREELTQKDSSKPEKKEKAEKKEKKIKTSAGGSLGGAFKAMIGFFTVFRTNPTEKDIKSMESNFWFVPAIGLLIGALAFFVSSIFFALGVDTIVIAVLALVTAFVVSKFLHFDGLVDLGDGLIATGDREKHIRALKDTAIGAGGFGLALTVILLSGTSYASLGWVLLIMIWPMEIIVKNAMVAAAAFGEPGNGMAAEQVRCVTKNSLMMSTVVTVVLAIATLAISWAILNLAMGFAAFDFSNFWEYVVAVIVGVVMSIAAGYLTSYFANKTFGFTNGDVLGATNEISRAICSLFILTVICLML